MISERYPGGTLFVRKIRAGDSDQEKVQLKCAYSFLFVVYIIIYNECLLSCSYAVMHKSRGCDEEALSVKDAARKLTAALEYVEASRGEEQCQSVFQGTRLSIY